ncbi:hypothetical protein [Peribacillus simplex]|uniref:hypothetical protein n=1 Tax=Peribacillus simplex TaxID=1478 RepID=UPI003D9C173B
MKHVPIHKDEDGLIVPPLEFTRPEVAEVLIKLTTSKKLILSQNSPETPEALNFLNELVEVGKLKVVIDR